MNIDLGKKLNILANILPSPLYAVGGVVRNFFIDGSISKDIDLCGAITVETLESALDKVGLKIVATYPRTGTVVFKDGDSRCEFTSFRKDTYVGGEHNPTDTVFTDNIEDDARRRDFKCNAVYYDIKNQRIVDPLNGVKDIQERRLDTVVLPDSVFKHDGLRLMRLARFSAELNFTPTKEVLLSAERYSDNIKEISAERIYAELKMILSADTKYPFSDKNGHYSGLKILDKTRVLDKIFPELTLGRGMVQRADYHKFDVLEHTLKTVLYSPKSVRLGALLHDIGKPYCMIKNGKYHNHNLAGEVIAKKVLERLKVDNITTSQVVNLTREHMVDMDCKMREVKVRKYIVKNQALLDDLLALKQADFTASLETGGISPTVKKWQGVYSKMKTDGTPFTLKDLKVKASDIIDAGIKGERIGKVLNQLFVMAVESPEKNQREVLLKNIKTAQKKGKKTPK